MEFNQAAARLQAYASSVAGECGKPAPTVTWEHKLERGGRGVAYIIATPRGWCREPHAYTYCAPTAADAQRDIKTMVEEMEVFADDGRWEG